MVEAREPLPGRVPRDRIAQRRVIEPLPQGVWSTAHEAEVALRRAAGRAPSTRPARTTVSGVEETLHTIKGEFAGAPPPAGEQVADSSSGGTQRPRQALVALRCQETHIAPVPAE